MRLSESNKTKLYQAISEPMMDMRIAIIQSKNVLGDKNANDLDEMMFKLERNVWSKVKAVLKLDAGV